MLNKKMFVWILGGVLSATVSAADITISQNDKTFKKDGGKVESLTISAGDTVHFKNEDPFFS